jgi:hypothetical protein
VLLAALALGLGLLLEAVAGTRIPDAVLIPSGFAALIVVASLCVAWSATARLATPLVVCLAAAGLVVSGRPWRRLDGWGTTAAAFVFCAFGAPVIRTGEPTFAGYIKLDDTATFLALADRVLEHGRSLAGLAPSTYEATLTVNLGHGYPVGAVLPLGVAGELLRTDVAWLFQPSLSFGAAALALSLFHLVRPLVPARPAAAFVAAIGTLSALLYGFALWGGLKELTVAPLVVVAAVLAGRGGTGRALLPLGVAAVAVVETVSVAGLVWLLPLVPALVPALRRTPWRVASATACSLLLALPALFVAGEFLRASNRESLASGSELGNLVRALPPWQIAGVWLAGDFRVDAEHGLLTALLAVLVLGGVGAAVVLAVRRRTWPLLLALASVGAGAVVFGLAGSPWVASKAFAVASPVVLAAAVAGWLGWADETVYRARAAWAVAVSCAAFGAAALTCGVLWSDALAYRDAWLAPRSQLAELERIGSRFVGQGPALMTEYQPYGARHFLRRLDAEGASELRRRVVTLRSGATAEKGAPVDLDEIEPTALEPYGTLVLRRSPTASRPPATFRLVWRGGWYEVWQRTRPGALAHLPLGGALQPGGAAPCVPVRRLALLGAPVAAPRAVNVAAGLDAGSLPSGWFAAGGGAVVPSGDGTLALTVTAPAGRYRLWLAGSARGRLTVRVDGRPRGRIERQLQNAGQWLELGEVDLADGAHQVELSVSQPRLAPGAGGGGFPLGPALLQPVAARPLLRDKRAEELCGRWLDWVEADRTARR